MSQRIDDIGKKFGRLTVIGRKRENKKTYYLCKCDCGNEKWIRADHIRKGITKSCGCLQYKRESLVGKRFGRLVVTELCNERAKNGERRFKCVCDCGNECIVNAGSLIDCRKRSCGCLHKETSKKNVQRANAKMKEIALRDGTNIKLISKKDTFKSNTSGVSGVYWDSKEGKWGVQIYFKGKCHRFGRYSKKEEAIKVRDRAKEELHEKFLEELDENS